jgi:hypothetical protein
MRTMFRQLIHLRRIFLLAALVAASVVIATDATSAQAQQKTPAQAAVPAPSSTPYRNQPNRMAKRAEAYYESVWGIDDLNVKAVESGVILRFTYRVLDPEKAKALSDKKIDPFLISPEKGVKLVIPSMEKVGQLRQAPHELEAGKSYWMAFSNSGLVLRKGDRVDIVIGSFRAEGLLVE